MSRNYLWWLLEIVIWYIFFYVALFSIKNDINIGGVAFVLLLLGSLGVFASPLTRHLSIWNKILDNTVKKEEEKTKF